MKVLQNNQKTIKIYIWAQQIFSIEMKTGKEYMNNESGLFVNKQQGKM